MTDNKTLKLLEHFLYSCSVVGIARTNFNIYFQDDNFVVGLAEESDFGCWVLEQECIVWWDIEDKRSVATTVDFLEILFKKYSDWLDSYE